MVSVAPSSKLLTSAVKVKLSDAGSSTETEQEEQEETDWSLLDERLLCGEHLRGQGLRN